MANEGLVWVVDDSAVEAEVARQSLAGYQTAVFVDGASALEGLSVAARLPDVLVLDWQMPGVSGIEVCQFLRSQPAMQTLPILLLTGNQQTEDIVEGLAAGANDYVTKPFSSAELLARVDALMRSKRLRERAERAESELRSLLEELPEALLVVDSQRRISFVNAMAESVFACARAELLGKPIGEIFDGLFPSDLATSAATAALPLSLNDVSVNDRVYAPALRVVRLGEEAPSVLVTLRDVTEKRQADARRLDFYSIIAHDLRSPLSSMHLRTELMLEGAHGELPELLASDVRKLAERIADMVALINDFLDLARLEGADFRLTTTAVDLIAVARRILDDVMPMAQSRSQTLTLVGPPSTVLVMGDERRLAQVLMNLVSNALKFTPTGGKVKVELRLVQTAGNVEVSVVDNGRGIAPEMVARVFERYVRGAAEPGDAVSTGLGLLIVKEIVEGLRGQVGVESAPGQGSRFWFRLPCASTEASA